MNDPTAVALGVMITLSLLLAWLAMLTVGNFGFSQFGFAECLPVGFILYWLGKSTSR